MPEADPYRRLTAAAVLLVAAIAAGVSYLHITDLALAWGQPRAAAFALPVSVDGMVATSSLVMLRAARLAVTSPWLGRAGLALGVAATLAANVASGLPHGWPNAVLSGWPAVAFIVSAETAISMSRPRRTRPAQRPAARPDAATPASEDRPQPERLAAPVPAPRPPSSANTVAGYRALKALHPDLTQKAIAADLGISERTLRRRLAEAEELEEQAA